MKTFRVELTYEIEVEAENEHEAAYNAAAILDPFDWSTEYAEEIETGLDE